MEKMNSAVERMKMLVGMDVDVDVDEEASSSALDASSFSFVDDFNRNCTLSTKQRFYGFSICLAAGLTCTLLILDLNSPSAVCLGHKESGGWEGRSVHLRPSNFAI
ncbi:Vesicle transport protein, SFT2-like [Parasponia andersonii]|uniref:Vesicle transport protein, SFT2-like n=1 Tax=Parasponia andersonii TaxID=3476 RepID=A0A2P5AGD1_PARAD|nr:Vesicle transport protein, SFT2-like [Parasponia andersonii]